MSNKPMRGSICLSDLSTAFKANHSSFSKSEKNGKIYANITVWFNPEGDQYGNHLSFQLNSKKDVQEDKVYFGNAKALEQKTNDPAPTLAESDEQLPF